MNGHKTEDENRYSINKVLKSNNATKTRKSDLADDSHKKNNRFLWSLWPIEDVKFKQFGLFPTAQNPAMAMQILCRWTDHDILPNMWFMPMYCASLIPKELYSYHSLTKEILTKLLGEILPHSFGPQRSIKFGQVEDAKTFVDNSLGK